MAPTRSSKRATRQQSARRGAAAAQALRTRGGLTKPAPALRKGAGRLAARTRGVRAAPALEASIKSKAGAARGPSGSAKVPLPLKTVAPTTVEPKEAQPARRAAPARRTPAPSTPKGALPLLDPATTKALGLDGVVPGGNRAASGDSDASDDEMPPVPQGAAAPMRAAGGFAGTLGAPLSGAKVPKASKASKALKAKAGAKKATAEWDADTVVLRATNDVVVTKREVLRQLKAYKAEFGALDTEDVDVLTGDEQSFYMFEERAGGALYTSVVKPLAGSADPLVGKYVEAVFKVDATDDDEEGQSSMYEGRIITGFDGGMFPGVYLVQYSDCALELVTIEDGDTSEFPITLMNPQPNSIKFNTRPRSELLA